MALPGDVYKKILSVTAPAPADMPQVSLRQPDPEEVVVEERKESNQSEDALQSKVDELQGEIDMQHAMLGPLITKERDTNDQLLAARETAVQAFHGDDTGLGILILILTPNF